ncbi:MAG: hypothetical protein U1E59_10380 [Amaricoccus sp.]
MIRGILRPERRRFFAAFALMLAAVLSLFHVVDKVAGPVLGPLLDAPADEVAQEIAIRAGKAFAVSKTINAALSFAEKVTVTGDAFIVEGSIQPAAALTPINNLIDQFARIMLVVAASALTIDLLLKIGAGYGTWLLLAFPLILFAASMALGHLAWAPRVRRVAWFALVVAVVVRLALPIALVTTGAVSDHYLAEHYRNANAGLELLQSKTDAAAVAVDAAESKGWVAAVKDAVTGAFSAVKESFTGTFDDIVTMVTIFFLETVVLPLAIILALWRGTFLLLSPGVRRGSAPPRAS